MGSPVITRLAVLLALGACTLAAKVTMGAVHVAPLAEAGRLPLAIGAWRGQPGATLEPRVVEALGVDSYVNRAYWHAGRSNWASVYVGYYRSRAHGRSMHSPLNCLPGAGWEAGRPVRLSVAGGSFRRVTVRKGPSRYVVIYWYQSAGRAEGDEYRSLLYTAYDTLRDGRNDAALVRVMVAVGDDSSDEAHADGSALDLGLQLEPLVREVLFSS